MFLIANWKMQLTYNESVLWIKEYGHGLADIVQNTHTIFVLCPSFTSLSFFSCMYDSIGMKLGAQDCSFAEQGAYTGEISAISLKELGCSYCIIGHSERRIYCNETIDIIAKKACILMQHHIEPIVCIGETEEQRAQGITLQALQQQLEPVLHAVRDREFRKIAIAYEPLWAIGTGRIPTSDELTTVMEWLTLVIQSYPLLDGTLLYGGSVQAATVSELRKIKYLKGFLVGKASIDFQALKSILQALS